MRRTRRHASAKRRARNLLWCWVPFLAAGIAAASCSREQPAPRAAESAMSLQAVDTLGATNRIASDASLLVVSAAGAADAMRAVADSFAAFEGVQVVFEIGEARSPIIQSATGEVTADVLVTAHPRNAPPMPASPDTAAAQSATADDPEWEVRFATDTAAAYSISLPPASASRALGERFVRFLLSPTGRALVTKARLVVPAAVIATGREVPPNIAALVDSTRARPPTP